MGNSLLVLSVFVLISAGVVRGADRPITKISLISAPFGTGSYVLSSALEDMSKKSHPWLRIGHSESPGLVFNIKKLDKEPDLKKTMIVSSTTGVNWLAKNGIKPFDKKYPMVQLLANYNLIAVWLGTLNPSIKAPKDLVGKKVALGRVTQISWTIEPEWIIRHGWGIRDKVKIEYVGLKESMTALLDGLVDAAVIGGYLDPLKKRLSLSPQTIELMASGKAVYHISWGEEAVKKTSVEMEMAISPYTIPTESVKGQKEPLSVFVDSVAWCATPEFPEEIAYELTKFIIKNCSKFGEYGDLGKLMSPQALPFGWPPERIHPGAFKAYKEAGILK